MYGANRISGETFENALPFLLLQPPSRDGMTSSCLLVVYVAQQPLFGTEAVAFKLFLDFKEFPLILNLERVFLKAAWPQFQQEAITSIYSMSSKETMKSWYCDYCAAKKIEN